MRITLVGNSLPLRIGVVGTGRWGSVLLREASRVEDLDVVAAVSPSAPIKSLSVVGFADLSHAVAQTDLTAVVVAVPRNDSARTVASALDLGLHVLAEKPLCMHQDECDSLYDRARSVDRVLRVNYTYLFQEGVQSLLAAARTQPALDLELRVVDPDRSANREDMIWDWGPHLMSLAEAFGLAQPATRKPALVVAQPTLTRDADGWTLTVHSAAGRTARLTLRHKGDKERILHMASPDGIRTVDLLVHTGISPVQLSLQRFAEDVMRAGEEHRVVTDENLTRAVTLALSSVSF